MDAIRVLIQERLDAIDNIDSGIPRPDEMIEDGQTYFGYNLSQDYIDGDFNRNYSMQITLNGHIVRKNGSTENTVQIIDEALANVTAVLKAMNFRYSYEDVNIDNNIRKIHVTAFVKYNEINDWLI